MSQTATDSGNGKSAFVTGGAGFLGYHLVQALLAADWKVTVFDNQTPENNAWGAQPVTTVTGSITEADTLLAAMPENLDGVFHVAGNTSLWGRNVAAQNRVNIEGTRNVVAAALARRCRRLVHTSSFTVYGFHQQKVTEETPCRGDQAGINYFHSKFLAEQEIRAGVKQGLDAVIVNPANIMGPRDTRNWAQLFLLINAGKLPGAPSGTSSFCHVGAVASAHLAAYAHGRCGENYLLGGVDLSYRELVDAIGAALNKPVPARTIPPWLGQSVARVAAALAIFSGREPDVTPEKARFFSEILVCSNSKSINELGYVPADLATMVADTRDWLVSAGLLDQ